MYKVMFENCLGKKRTLAVVNTMELANKTICDFLKEKDFKSYYQRRWKIDDKTIKVDVGSHTEFFEIIDEAQS